VIEPDAVWITGVGVSTTLGHTYAHVAEALLAGRSGIDTVTAFDVSKHPSQIAARLDNVPCPEGWDPTTFVARSRADQIALWCGVNALRDADLWTERDSSRIGLLLGVGSEWLIDWEEDARRGGNSVREPSQPPSHVQKVAQELGLSGPCTAISTACASGNTALMLARRWLELGWVDVCLAGACGMNVTPMSLAAFGNLRALSRRNEAPQTASRPFDRDRDGFVMGEGGALFVLERSRGAQRRGARAYAQVAGCGSSSDAHHPVIPSPDPQPAVQAITQALADAEVAAADIDYINAHGTATPVGDVSEALALHVALGTAVDRVPVSSTKSMTGHLLAGAAAVEALACLVALDRQALPPTINLDDPDPKCALCHVPKEARGWRVQTTLSNSFGFGGSNTALVLRAV
jgi:3-oxoacyl-[acyl-carrier-protein] synthase II